jgi:hypothetical protein
MFEIVWKLGDVTMSESLITAASSFKIRFLNSKVDEDHG